MFSICFKPDQHLDFSIHQNKKEMNIHSSHARPKTKTSDKLVGFADYMVTSLEVNDNHTMHMYIEIHVQQMHMWHN